MLHGAEYDLSLLGRALGLRRAVRLNTLDSAVALNVAFFVNAAILVMAAAVFHSRGHEEVAGIEEAHRLLEPILGVSIAPVAFAVALLASGQSSTITGTLAGQIVMEGYLNFRVRPWLRRMITRLLAVVPAALTILYLGEGSTGSLLVLSQVVLSLQLPFAVIPLIHFVSDRERMGALVIGARARVLAWVVAGAIVVLNVALVAAEVSSWLASAGRWAWLVDLAVLPVLAAAGLLLLFVTFAPLVARARAARWAAVATGVHSSAEEIAVRLETPAPYRRVAVALDFHGNEERLLNEALRLTAGSGEASITLMHVVESPVARAFGARAADFETQVDARRLQTLCDALARAGHKAELRLGLGAAVRELARMIDEAGADAVLLGSHGHRGLADVIHGTTADALRHRVSATVVIVPGA